MLNKQNFLLNEKVLFLNNGSYGACPREVFKVYQEWQRIIEFQPVEFYQKTLIPALQRSRDLVGNIVNTAGENLILISNATYAVNLVIRSLDLSEEDEVLVTSHEYGACLNAWQFWQQEKGFRIRIVDIDLPLPKKTDLIKLFEAKITSATKVIFFSHITSFTAQLFPAEEICALARKHGIISVVDGAHAIGQIPLDLQKIKADFYFSNLHKWFFSPKGTAFLYTQPALQKIIKPLITGWGWGKNRELPSGSEYVDSNQFYGTADLSSFLTIPSAVEFYEVNNIATEKQRCNFLVKYFLQEMNKFTAMNSLYTIHPEELMMGVVEIPRKFAKLELKELLYHEFKIEVPVIEWSGKLLIRISVQIYNSKEDVDHFLAVLKELFG